MNVGIFRYGERLVLRPQRDPDFPVRQLPDQKRALCNGTLKPFEGLLRRAPVQIDFNGPLFVPRKLAHLQIAGVGCAFPVHQPGTVGGFIGTNPVKVEPGAAPQSLHLAGHVLQQQLRFRKRLQRGVNDRFPMQHYPRAFPQKAEREFRGKHEQIVMMPPAPRKRHLNPRFDLPASRHQGEIDGFAQDRRRAVQGVGAARQLNGERRRQEFQISQADHGGGRRACGNVFRKGEFQFQPRQYQAAQEAGYQQQRQHGGKHQKQQVIGGEKRSGAGQQQRQQEQQTAARNAVSDPGPDPVSGRRAELLPVHRVRVTLLSVRGRSGSRFFSAASAAANNCAGMM